MQAKLAKTDKNAIDGICRLWCASVATRIAKISAGGEPMGQVPGGRLHGQMIGSRSAV